MRSNHSAVFGHMSAVITTSIGNYKCETNCETTSTCFVGLREIIISLSACAMRVNEIPVLRAAATLTKVTRPLPSLAERGVATRDYDSTYQCNSLVSFENIPSTLRVTWAHPSLILQSCDILLFEKEGLKHASVTGARDRFNRRTVFFNENLGPGDCHVVFGPP